MHRNDIDAIKGISILSVVLFHLGLLKSGYLGVDVFFVINGFLVIPSVCKQFDQKSFSFLNFMEKRMVRLMPLVVIASAVCLLVGFIGMLPDAYENLADAVIASNAFSENILSAITTKNYWDVGNDYKPLMHLWYVGILFEFYILLPLVMYIGRWVTWNWNSEDRNRTIIATVAAISFILYLLPIGTDSDKFYFIQYRFFELAIGGVLGLCVNKNKGLWQNTGTDLKWISSLLLIFIVFSSVCTFKVDEIGTQEIPIGLETGKTLISDGLINSKPTLLILTVILTLVVLAQDNSKVCIYNSKILTYLGSRSYSIFIWHQIVLAFYRYFISDEITVPFVLGFFAIVLLLSELSYRLIEQKVKVSHKSFVVWIIAAMFVAMPATWIHIHAGVVRDVPELNITVKDAHRGMHGEYCDRIYAYDKDFPNNGKLNVLVEGVSFGRDFANCLLESDYADKVNLSYVFTWGKVDVERIREADVIFSFTSKSEVPNEVWLNKKVSAEVYGIGTKNYGKSNGVIYTRRFKDDYLKTTIALNSQYKALNKHWESEWGDKYIDFIKMAEDGHGRIRVFTPDGKFISQDCRHLTKEGAQWYASLIKWDEILQTE